MGESGRNTRYGSRFPEALNAVANAIKLDPKDGQALELRKNLTDAERQR